MAKKTKIEKTQDESIVEQLATEIVESVSKDDSIKYVVVRDDKRVSDNEYADPRDPKAIEERDFWKQVCNRWSPSERAEIVKFNKKKHRNW